MQGHGTGVGYADAFKAWHGKGSDATEANVQVQHAPVNLEVTALYAIWGTLPATTVTYTGRNNGADGNLTFTASSGTAGHDNSHNDIITAGNPWDINQTHTGGTTNQNGIAWASAVTANIPVTVTTDVTSDADIQTTNNSDVTSSADIQTTNTKDVTSDADISITGNANLDVTSSADISTTGTSSVTSSACITRTEVSNVTSSACITTTRTTDVTSSAAISVTGVATEQSKVFVGYGLFV
jgi:hypothetical protein